MSIIVANGLLVTEAYYLLSDLVSDNPVVPRGVSIYSYGSIGGSGEYLDVKGYLGSDIVFNNLIPIFSNSSNKRPKAVAGSAMPADNVYTYTLTSGDIAGIGPSISVIGILVNNECFPASFSFSGNQGSLIAGDTISFTGLPAKADVTTLNFVLI